MTADSSGLGTKPVARLALTMSVPTIVAQAANASYTIIDRLFIGHIPEVGDAAMTGVGICFPILLAVTAFASLIGAGGAPRASIELGRGNFKKAERILGTSAAFLVAIALTLTVILQATKEPVLSTRNQASVASISKRRASLGSTGSSRSTTSHIITPQPTITPPPMAASARAA